MLKGNMLIAQGGGPTPVINSSLLGAVREAKRHPEAIETIYGARFGAEGILAGDLIVFRSASDEVSITVDKVTDTYATFIVPDGMKRGEYDLYVVRGDLEQKICKVSIWITASFDIPDRTGCNIKGVVYCEDTGVSGVVVSDGYQTTVTDSNGYFWLASQKQNG